MTKDIKILIVTKKRNDSYGISYGLNNSAMLTEKYLNKKGVQCKYVSVIDNNCIDKEIHLYKPTHILLEAIWVTPEKISTLIKLHNNIEWIVRIHSELPFLANEGIAVEWLNEYSKIPKLCIASNNKRMVRDINKIGIKNIYLPNLYNITEINETKIWKDKIIDVGCFGAIRPMKNQFIQACAAIQFAEENHLTLRFHINANRIEQKGEQILKNIRNLFKYKTHHKLIENDWMPHNEFLKYLKSHIDVGLQVSFSETFNIVTADYITAEVPCVVSKEINWMPFWTYASANDMNSIAKTIGRVLFINVFFNLSNVFNKKALNSYNEKSFEVWENF